MEDAEMVIKVRRVFRYEKELFYQKLAEEIVDRTKNNNVNSNNPKKRAPTMATAAAFTIGNFRSVSSGGMILSR